MSKNTKHKDYKRLLALREKEDELDKAIKNLGYVELEKPIHHGFNAYLTLREDVAKREDKVAGLYQYFIDNFAPETWSRLPSFYTRNKKGKVNDNRPKLRRLTQKEYDGFMPWVQEHLHKRTEYNWGNEYVYYVPYVPEYYLVMKIKNSYITHRKVVDGELESQRAFVKDQRWQLEENIKPWNENGYSKFLKLIQKANRINNKLPLKININTVFINDSKEWLNEQGVDITERDFITDSDWTNWGCSSAWSQDFYEFKHKPRNEARWWYF
jgi:hypothetical protein